MTIPKSKSWEMFNQISARYDLLNHLLSWGLDISWRKKLKQFMPVTSSLRLLDLATGTADVLISLVRSNKSISKAIGLDMAEKMLNVGRSKVANFQLEHIIELKHGDANDLPFEDKSFDCATIAFGIRNVEQPAKVLREMNRVLSSGGRALILEFSLPANGFIRCLHIFYLRTIVPIIGWIISGRYKAYKYLNQTIEEFPYGAEFCELMVEAGFINVKPNPLLFGVATIYQGDKV